ncbi:MAG: winged helix-turn-helix domain-containing protein [Nanoarchaeota archaeon]|nr:winged helix-turn-helix domain-containing protein [Nanoarchaeota archaeon]MBU1596850.1 winged helix-turn-helix domain-containing protein [Nanoarchaeota archaeon]
MDTEELLSKSRWKILKELAKAPRSAVEIAKKTSQSVANVTQQLQLLEAYHLIKKASDEKDPKEHKPGKPKTRYLLSQEILLTTVLKSGIAEKKVLKFKEADDFQKFLINLFFIIDPEYHNHLIKFVSITDMIQKADTIAYLKSGEKEIEIMIITEHIKEVREKYSNMNVVGFDGKTKKIISWSHNKKEVEEGLERKEEYFVNLVKNSIVLLDKKDYLAELKQKL